MLKRVQHDGEFLAPFVLSVSKDGSFLWAERRRCFDKISTKGTGNIGARNGLRARGGGAWWASVRSARVRHLLGWWEGRQSWLGFGSLRTAPPAMSSLRGASLCGLRT